MRRAGALIVVLGLGLVGCSAQPAFVNSPGEPTAAADSTFDPRPDPYTPTATPPAPTYIVTTPTPAPARQQPTVTITFFGTDATFTWTDANGMHQVQQSGPYEAKLPYSVGHTTVNANAVSMAKDAGCKVTLTNDLGDATVVMDNTLAGQTLASCTKLLQ